MDFHSQGSLSSLTLTFACNGGFYLALTSDSAWILGVQFSILRIPSDLKKSYLSVQWAIEHHALSNAAMQLVLPACYDETQHVKLRPYILRSAAEISTPFSVCGNAHQQFARNTVNTILSAQNCLHFYPEPAISILKFQFSLIAQTPPVCNSRCPVSADRPHLPTVLSKKIKIKINIYIYIYIYIYISKTKILKYKLR